MKKHWHLLALVLAVLLLGTACAERKTVDVSDAGDRPGYSTGTRTNTPPKTTQATAEPEKPAETEAETASTAEPAEEVQSAQTGSATAAGPTGRVDGGEVTMNAPKKGMCLVPLNTGAVFVINGKQAGDCTIKTDPKDYIVFNCTMKVKDSLDANMKFVLLQGGNEVLTAEKTITIAGGENTVQMLVRVGGTAIGQYTGRLYINGELIGEGSVTA